jgi:hypothetical protein
VGNTLDHSVSTTFATELLQTILWFALEMEFVKIQILVLVLLDTQEINVKLQFVTEKQILLLAQLKMEHVSRRIIVLVISSIQELNVNKQFVLELVQMIPQFVLVTEFAKTQMFVNVMQITQVIIVIFQNVMVHLIHLLVLE